MYKFFCVLALVSGVCTASIGNVNSNSSSSSIASTNSSGSSTVQKDIVPVLKFETNKKPDGSFHFSYEGADRSFREESGVLENAGTDDEALEVSGSYRYIDADGQEVEVHYTAGRNGFVPVGTHILSEITAVAQAAANLPNVADEQETRRRARSKAETAEATETAEKAKAVEKSEKTEEIIPVQVVQATESVENKTEQT